LGIFFFFGLDGAKFGCTIFASGSEFDTTVFLTAKTAEWRQRRKEDWERELRVKFWNDVPMKFPPEMKSLQAEISRSRGSDLPRHSQSA
jgi:hypothetical protein